MHLKKRVKKRDSYFTSFNANPLSSAMHLLDFIGNEIHMSKESENSSIEIYKGVSGEVVFDVDIDEETIWATQAQMADLFDVDRTVISRHIRNIYAEGELKESTYSTSAKNARVQKKTCKDVVQVRNEGGRNIKRKVKAYNLDMVISVGYRVNSKKATNFRIWATSVLKKYVTDGVVINQSRLEAMQARKEIKKLHDVEHMMRIVRRLTSQKVLDAGEATGVLEVISRYAGSFETLKEFDSNRIDLSFLNEEKKIKELTVELCNSAVEQLKVSVNGSDLFGKKRGEIFDGNLVTIFQSFDGKELYPNIPQKAANLLYFVIKDHPFYDGNKRIGALLFVLFLTMNNYHLTSDGETKISDRALTAIALLIAESEPKEKELIVSLVCKLLE